MQRGTNHDDRTEEQPMSITNLHNQPHCMRCGRLAPDEGSYDSLFWEAADSQGDRLVCPGCLTGAEQQAMDEEMMALGDSTVQDES